MDMNATLIELQSLGMIIWKIHQGWARWLYLKNHWSNKMLRR